MLLRRTYDTTICGVFLAKLIRNVYFCANELAVAPLNKGGKEIILEKRSSELSFKTDRLRNNFA